MEHVSEEFRIHFQCKNVPNLRISPFNYSLMAINLSPIRFGVGGDMLLCRSGVVQQTGAFSV